MTGVIGVLIGVVVIWVMRSRRTRVRARRNAEAIDQCLPDAIDLLRLAAHAGISVHQLIPAVLPRFAGAIQTAFAEVQRRVERGVRLGEALDALETLGENAEALCAVLRSTAFDGTSLTPALERVANDARLARRRRAEQMARRLPVQLLFPLVFCVLPAFALLAVVPLLAGSLVALAL
jgi:tight adherence protein C